MGELHMVNIEWKFLIGWVYDYVGPEWAKLYNSTGFLQFYFLDLFWWHRRMYN